MEIEDSLQGAVKGMKDMDKTISRLKDNRRDLGKRDGSTNKRVERWTNDMKTLSDKNKD